MHARYSIEVIGAPLCVGDNFGPIDEPTLHVYSYPPSSPSQRTFPTNCRVSQAHVEVSCTTAPSGGADAVWVVQLGAQSSLPPRTEMVAPVLFDIRVVEGRALSARGYRETLVATGARFGGNEDTNIVTLTATPTLTQPGQRCVALRERHDCLGT